MNASINCAYCGKIYSILYSSIRRNERLNRPNYCSPKCRALATQHLVKTACRHCGTELFRTTVELKKSKDGNSFCSHSCAAKFNNSIRMRVTNTHAKYRNRTRENGDHCIQCGSALKENAIKFCSLTCQQRYLFLKRIEQWLIGEINGTDKVGASRYIKRYLIETRGNKCELCGWNKINPVTNKVPIELDHIDGNHKNNRPENLRLLCPNCHSLTETYKALNKGNGRESRRTT